MRDLLETRFQMKIHHELKDLSIYALVVAKGGPKIKPVASDGPAPEGQLAVVRAPEGPDGFPKVSLPSPGVIIETREGKARVTIKDSPVVKLADLLTRQVGRPVLDMTGLAGNYSFELYFVPEGQDVDGGSDIFGAVVQQLGLRLDSRRAPVEVVVIDHVEKIPIEN